MEDNLFAAPKAVVAGAPASLNCNVRRLMRNILTIAFLLLSVSVRGQSVVNAKTESETLMNEAIPFAEKMLRKRGEFYPYGYVMKPSGEIALVAGYDGTDRPKSQDIIDLLVAGFKQDAAIGKVKATALVYDVIIIPPGASEKSDAIAVALDHRDHYSVVVIFPYVLRHGELTIGAPFAQKGGSRIFASKESN
jgi:hypothetical protein